MSSEVPVPSPPEGQLPIEPNELNGVTADETSQPAPLPNVRGWHRPLLGAVLLLVVFYAVVLPIVMKLVDTGKDAAKLQPMPLSEAIELNTMKAFSILWIVALGGTVGSFLNVVAYRMPRGKSVIFSPSRCPRCSTNIRPSDNIPVLGWLRLEGMCRACRNPISARYPIVEAIVAGLFLLFFAAELTSGGANLPLRTPNNYGIVWTLFELRWDLIQLYLYHCVLFSLLVSWVLVDLDHQQVTLLGVMVGTSIMLAPLFIWPHLMPVPAIWPAEAVATSLSQTLLASFVGGLVGVTLGVVLGLAFKNRVTDYPEFSNETNWLGAIQDDRTVRSLLNLTSVLAFVGTALGWQAAISIVILALFFRACSLLSLNRLRFRLPLTTFVLIGAILHQLGWRWLSYPVGSLISESSVNLAGLAGLVLLVIVMILVNRLSLVPLRTLTV